MYIPQGLEAYFIANLSKFGSFWLIWRKNSAAGPSFTQNRQSAIPSFFTTTDHLATSLATKACACAGLDLVTG